MTNLLTSQVGGLATIQGFVKNDPFPATETPVEVTPKQNATSPFLPALEEVLKYRTTNKAPIALILGLLAVIVWRYS